MKNNNLNYLDDKYGHMNANILYAIKEDLQSMPFEDIIKEVEDNNYPINNYKKMTKEALIEEIIIFKADNDTPVEADELEAILTDDTEFLNE